MLQPFLVNPNEEFWLIRIMAVLWLGLSTPFVHAQFQEQDSVRQELLDRYKAADDAYQKNPDDKNLLGTREATKNAYEKYAKTVEDGNLKARSDARNGSDD